jgi:hypothetical protein
VLDPNSINVRTMSEKKGLVISETIRAKIRLRLETSARACRGRDLGEFGDFMQTHSVTALPEFEKKT